jgi:hypothetical protein
MTRSSSIVGTLLFIHFGPIVWALHLGFSYAVHAAICEADERLPLGPAALPWLLGAGTVAAALAILAGLLLPDLVGTPLHAARNGQTGAFVSSLMRFLAVLSLLGVGYFGLSMLLVPICLPIR